MLLSHCYSKRTFLSIPTSLQVPQFDTDQPSVSPLHHTSHTTVPAIPVSAPCSQQSSCLTTTIHVHHLLTFLLPQRSQSLHLIPATQLSAPAYYSKTSCKTQQNNLDTYMDLAVKESIHHGLTTQEALVDQHEKWWEMWWKLSGTCQPVCLISGIKLPKFPTLSSQDTATPALIAP